MHVTEIRRDPGKSILQISVRVIILITGTYYIFFTGNASEGLYTKALAALLFFGLTINILLLTIQCLRRAPIVKFDEHAITIYKQNLVQLGTQCFKCLWKEVKWWGIREEDDMKILELHLVAGSKLQVNLKQVNKTADDLWWIISGYRKKTIVLH